MKINWKTMSICLAIPLLTGALAGVFSMGSMETYATLRQPPLSPPGWLFPVVWTVLYLLMGISLYLVVTSGQTQAQLSPALERFGLQLLFNFFWTIWFFHLHLYFFAFAWLIVLWCLILATAISFARISKPAAWLLVPYLLWVAFAGYLNLGVALLN